MYLCGYIFQSTEKHKLNTNNNIVPDKTASNLASSNFKHKKISINVITCLDQKFLKDRVKKI